MSSPEGVRPVVLVRRAAIDFEEIGTFTGERWGIAQQQLYISKIDAALLAIGRNPEIGRRTPGFSFACRMLPAGSHAIYYRVEAKSILILRILHQRMNARIHMG